MRQRGLTLLLAVMACLVLLTVPAVAVEPTSELVNLDLCQGDITISENPDGGSVYRQGRTEIVSTGSCFIRQTDLSGPTTNRIIIQSGEQEITIAGLKVEAEQSPIQVKGNAALVLNLVGSSTLTATGWKAGAGIGVGSGRDGTASLTIQGSGSVTANGGNDSAGIGGTGYSDGGIITINGGTVTANGGSEGAGIGGASGSSGTITINGGTVTANGGSFGVGIGGDSEGGFITIRGGVVHAAGSAGIGSIYGNTIVISGGTVTAIGNGGPGIGTFVSNAGGGGTVLIRNAEVTAEGDDHAIGGCVLENQRGCDSITIESSAIVHLKHSNVNGSACQERIKGLELSADTAALPYHVPLVKTIAYGHSGIIAYQWQTSTDNTEQSVWTDVDGQTAATMSDPLIADNENHFYRCKVTNKYGNVVYTSATQLKFLEIIKQPANVDTNIENAAVLEVGASAANLTYEWQKSGDGGGSWEPVPNGDSNMLIVSTALGEDKGLYRCKVTATNGDFIFSNTARIAPGTAPTGCLIQYYLEDPDGSYTVTDQYNEEKPAGTAITVPERIFEHYTENIAMGTHNGTVVEDSTLVLSRYYDRNSYTLCFETNGGTQLPEIRAKFGTPVTLPEPSSMGCTFGGWFTDEGCTKAASLTEMPTRDMTLYAKWELIGSGRGDDEYTINGITLRDGSYQPITGNIPAGKFYAEVSVTNHSSTTMDTVLLASYDRNGRQLGLTFLYANPQIDQTFVLGSMVDNSDGKIAELRAFTLPTLGGLVPLSNSVTYPAK